MATIPKFTEGQLEPLARLIGDHFRGSELSRLLEQAGLPDPAPSDTKWRRLLDIFKNVQDQYGVGNHVGAFLQIVFEPARWVRRREAFDSVREAANETLAFSGLALGEDGRLRFVERARTLTDAQQRAGRLRAALIGRGVHADVLRFCSAELLQENYFHAVLEATKSVAAKIREKSGCSSDGASLVDEAIGGEPGRLPKLALNRLETPTDWGEHRGLMNLIKGTFGVFRNPTAHEPKIAWVLTEADALDLLTLASLLHRRLDTAIATGL